VEHRDFDAIGPVQRQRKVQRIDAGRLQRYTRPRFQLVQPADQRLVPAGRVVKNTLFKSFVYLLNGYGRLAALTSMPQNTIA
jgi:hypothetical protein